METPLYHGGRARLAVGDLITPGRKVNPWGDESPKSRHVFFTASLDTALSYAAKFGTRGHVYEVAPTGDVKHDHSHADYKSEHPLRVTRVVPRAEWPEWAKK